MGVTGAIIVGGANPSRGEPAGPTYPIMCLAPQVFVAGVLCSLVSFIACGRCSVGRGCIEKTSAD